MSTTLSFRALRPACNTRSCRPSITAALRRLSDFECPHENLPEHFQGQPFAGTSCGPRRYAFSNRNRMDEAIDFVRSARDERYRYIRNYMPHLPWGQHIDFMWKQAGYRRWEQLHLAGGLPEVQDRFWREKPYEELYDLEADPDEVTYLVDDPT